MNYWERRKEERAGREEKDGRRKREGGKEIKIEGGGTGWRIRERKKK